MKSIWMWLWRRSEMPAPKQATSFRLSDEALMLIRELAVSLGVSQAAVVEMAVRKLAKEHQS